MQKQQRPALATPTDAGILRSSEGAENSPAASPDQVIADIPKNPRELLRVQVREFKGHRFADVRIHYRNGEDIKPSGKGVTAKAEQLEQLIYALQRAKAALEAE